MALGIGVQSEELSVFCPWCGFELHARVNLGDNSYRCSNCTCPFILKITLSKDYANTKTENYTYLQNMAENKKQAIKQIMDDLGKR